jgi:hypothetical protein
MRSWNRLLGVLTLTMCALAAAARPSSAQWLLESKDGKASLKIGFLIQPQMELLETVDQEGVSTNLFLRRLRVLLGGTIDERWSFFFETDSPNLGKTNPNPGSGPGLKDQGDIFVQDAYLTYSRGSAFKVDAGMFMLPPERHAIGRHAAGHRLRALHVSRFRSWR